ncbi:MAG: hypothetical protein IJ323_03765 [Clostridia bacterium]|nr:hypothetical protein [Clostridia bacterium]
MITLNLTAKGTEQELIKNYLEENASETLAEKINNGVKVEKDGKTLINKKTLEGFMKYATDEARKQAEKGASAACVRSDVVFGWAIHYFEEESIEEKLYNEDGNEYKAPKPVVKKTTTAPTSTYTPPVVKKPESDQLSLFDFTSDTPVITDTEETVEVGIEETIEEAAVEEDPIIEQPKISPLYTRYMALVEKYPTTLIALRVGDFYEIFGDAAERVAEKLELTLASRDFGLKERVPMVGFPYHRVDVYRDKIRQFSSVAIAESDDNIQFYLQFQKDGSDLQVNTETGEVTESNKVDDRVNDLIGILFGILKDDLEVRL